MKISTLAALALLSGVKGDFVYCGGGSEQSDPQSQASCTPYPALGWNDGDWCQSEDMYNFAGGDGKVGFWRAWEDDYTPAEDFWAFHGCDGAGIMQDIFESSFYIEQFGPMGDWDQSWFNNCESSDDCFNSDDEFNACAECLHESVPFVHPGTSQVYQWYNAGMWTNGPVWPDEVVNKPWFQTLKDQGLKEPEEYGLHDGPAATAYVIMYPWVCNYNEQKQAGEYWGDDGNWAKGLPYQDATYQVDCYYDNEPWDIFNYFDSSYDPHKQSTNPPPTFWVYKFIKTNPDDDFITGWQIGHKTIDDATFQETTGGDPFTLWWQNEFPTF